MRLLGCFFGTSFIDYNYRTIAKLFQTLWSCWCTTWEEWGLGATWHEWDGREQPIIHVWEFKVATSSLNNLGSITRVLNLLLVPATLGSSLVDLVHKTHAIDDEDNLAANLTIGRVVQGLDYPSKPESPLKNLGGLGQIYKASCPGLGQKREPILKTGRIWFSLFKERPNQTQIIKYIY